MEHIFWTADERSNRRKILAVSMQLKQLRKESLKKIQAWTGFEPMTSAMPVQCSTNWAIKPTGGWSYCEFVMYLEGWINDCKCMEHIFWTADERSNRRKILAVTTYLMSGSIPKAIIPPPPPRANPRAFDFFENAWSNSPVYGPISRSNAPLAGAEKSMCCFFFFVFASSVYIKINEIHTLINLKQFIIKDNA